MMLLVASASACTIDVHVILDGGDDLGDDLGDASEAEAGVETASEADEGSSPDDLPEDGVPEPQPLCQVPSDALDGPLLLDLCDTPEIVVAAVDLPPGKTDLWPAGHLEKLGRPVRADAQGLERTYLSPQQRRRRRPNPGGRGAALASPEPL